MNSKSYALQDSFQIEFHVFYWFLIERFKWVFCWNFLTVLQARFVLLFVGRFICTHNLSRVFFWDNIQEAIFSPSSVVLYRVTSLGVTSFMISIFSHSFRHNFNYLMIIYEHSCWLNCLFVICWHELEMKATRFRDEHLFWSESLYKPTVKYQ